MHADSRPAAARLKPRGVYLITGGLGDIGLAIAERLARDFEARLVLLGRTPLPPVGEWRDALEEAGIPERVKQRIRKLIEIESLGGEILALSCDVCSRDDLRRSIEAARTRFGPIDGVIHAAGAIEDGPLQLKSRESASRVLAPKVGGTLALVDVLREMTASDGGGATGFLAMFSSVSSATAPAGQVDYAAANAFLDAFAAGRREAGVVAINWGPWRDVGMAARASSSHPLLGRRVVDTPDEIVVSSSLDAKWNWMLAEHRLKGGKAVVPGTGYLEMACAALTRARSIAASPSKTSSSSRRCSPIPARRGRREWSCDGEAMAPSHSRSSPARRSGSSMPPGGSPGALSHRPRIATSRRSPPAADRASWPSTTRTAPSRSGISSSGPAGAVLRDPHR